VVNLLSIFTASKTMSDLLCFQIAKFIMVASRNDVWCKYVTCWGSVVSNYGTSAK